MPVPPSLPISTPEPGPLPGSIPLEPTGSIPPERKGRRHPSLRHPLERPLRRLLQLLLLGMLVGVACWPLNRLDRLQDLLLLQLPGFSGGSWSTGSLALAGLPLIAMPLLLLLQAGPLAAGAGSGIPQTIRCLRNPELAPRELAGPATLARLGLWTLATLALLPLGREGPVVAVGAAVVEAVRRRLPTLLAGIPQRQLLAIGAGAGLAGGFNSPLMGLLFVIEELTGEFQVQLLWPGALLCSAAALVSNLGGMQLFPLGMVVQRMPELEQLGWALLLGLGGGALGGGFARLLLGATAWLGPRVRTRPLRWGLLLGLGLALMALASGGWSGGDGEALMSQLVHGAGPRPEAPPADPTAAPLPSWALTVALRTLAPVLALGAGVPGGLIDPAFSMGAVLGHGLSGLLGGDPAVGLALGMAAGLAGATQLPITTVLFAMRMAGDQQLLFGLLVSAVIGAYVGRWLQPHPIYHALTELGERAEPSPNQGAGNQGTGEATNSAVKLTREDA